MYGDWGHGMFFFAMGIMLCLFDSKLRRMPAMEGLFVSRYFWLMMGFFSVYMGLIYNEFFALPVDFFGSCYNMEYYAANVETMKMPRVPYKGICDPGNDDTCHAHQECVYPFGLDPAWMISTNSLTFTNNIKEKLSVIIAYFHLNFGIVLNALNSIYFGNYKKLFCDIFTGIVIFLGLIGTMIILIYAKWWYPVWAYDRVGEEHSGLTVSDSPSIIVLVIGDIMGVTHLSAPNKDEW